MESQPKRRKRPNFSDEELRVLIQEVLKRKKILLGKFDAIAVTVQSKIEAWDAVTDAINRVSCVMREREEVRRKFAHHRWFVKKKAKARERRGNRTNDADSLSNSEEAMLSMISETPSNNLCESESPVMAVCEVDNGEEVSLTPDVEDLSTDNENSIGSTNRDSSLRQLKNFRVNRIEAVSVQNFDRGIDVTPVRIENEETNTNQIDSSVCVNSQSTMGGLRNFRMDKEESSKDQTLLLRYFRKEMKSSINTKLTKKDNHASSEKLKIWSHEGVLQLVEAYRTHMHMFSMTSLNSSQIWNKIAKKLQENGYTYTGELCKRKMQNLSTRYKSITENQESGSGRIRWSKWEYFDTMQDLFTNNPSGETSLATSLDTSLPTDPDDDPLQVDEIKTERDSPSAEYTNNSLSWNGIKTEVCHSSSEPEDDSFSWDEVKVEESSLFPEPVDDPALWSGVKMELCSTSPS